LRHLWSRHAQDTKDKGGDNRVGSVTKWRKKKMSKHKHKKLRKLTKFQRRNK